MTKLAGRRGLEQACEALMRRAIREGPKRVEEQTLQFRVRQIIVDAFSYGRYAGTPFESLVQPTKNFGIRGKSDTEIFALRLAVGAARAVDEIARELDHRNQAGP